MRIQKSRNEDKGYKDSELKREAGKEFKAVIMSILLTSGCS